MNSAKFFLFAFVICCGMSSCKKENALDVNADFKGLWTTICGIHTAGESVFITSGSDSKYSYSAYPEPAHGKGSYSITNDATIKDDELKIGRKSFHIDVYPSYDEFGNYRMVLDGKSFIAAHIPTNLEPTVYSDHALIHFVICDGSNSVSSSTVRYRAITDSVWTEINTQASATPEINGLTSGTTYVWGVKANYEYHSSQFSETDTLTTL